MAHPSGAAGAEKSLDRRLLASVLLNVVITAAEAAGGLVAGSLALLADAAHNLSDVVALALAFLARVIGRRPPSAQHTYGLRRVEVLAALANAVALFVVTYFIAREALHRLLDPQPVRAGLMFSIALVALVANLISVALLRKHERHDLNMKSAFLHLLQDAFVSLAVVLAALFARTPVGPYLDPVASLVVGFAVLFSAFSILWESFGMLVEGVPKGLEVGELVREVDERFSPARMHHVHVWEVGPGQRVLTAHVSVPDVSVVESERLFDSVRAYLKERWAIHHATLEAEVNGCGPDEDCGAPGGE